MGGFLKIILTVIRVLVLENINSKAFFQGPKYLNKTASCLHFYDVPYKEDFLR